MDSISADQKSINRLLTCFDKPDILVSGGAYSACIKKTKMC